MWIAARRALVWGNVAILCFGISPENGPESLPTLLRGGVSMVPNKALQAGHVRATARQLFLPPLEEITSRPAP